MIAKEKKIDWLYRLKKKILVAVLLVLAASIATTMVFIALKLRDSLVDESRMKTRELSVTINATLRPLMIMRAPEVVQNTIEQMVAENESIVGAFILDNSGRIAYSSDRSQVGSVLNKYEEASCRVCHEHADKKAGTRDVILDLDSTIHRNVMIIYNEKACYDCHSPSNRTTGKLIIDRSLSSTYSLITEVELIIFGSGLVCLAVLVPLFSRLLSRGIDKYIVEIFNRNEELRLLYVMVERLSKTLNLELLKEISIEIIKEVLGGDEIDIIIPRGPQDYSASQWTSATNKVSRKEIGERDNLQERLRQWLSGTLQATSVSDDRTEILMPVTKAEHRLGLIVIRRSTGSFDEMRIGLLDVIGSHIAVAFENAWLYYIAITDELTKTFTKRHFRHCIDQTFAEFQQYGTRFALLMIDIDDFKRVNDTYGHVTGDSVLRRIGELVGQAIREKDLAFRYGGEEFSLILPGTATKGARVVAERVRKSVESTVFEPGSIDLRLTVSIGISTCPSAPSIRDLIVAADTALYEAKEKGKNRVVMAPDAYESSSQSPEKSTEE